MPPCREPMRRRRCCLRRRWADCSASCRSRFAGGIVSRAGAWLRQWMPELGLPEFNDAELGELLPWACANCRSFAGGAARGLAGIASRQADGRADAGLGAGGAERLQVPSGSRLPLQYEPGRPPILAVRIQEIFGMPTPPAWPAVAFPYCSTCSPPTIGRNR